MLNYDELPQSFAFQFNLRHYIKVAASGLALALEFRAAKGVERRARVADAGSYTYTNSLFSLATRLLTVCS